jgi:hypothetical protein
MSMTLTQTSETVERFASQAFHRRFAAVGKAAPAINDRSAKTTDATVNWTICVNAANTVYVGIDCGWLAHPNAAVPFTVLKVNPDPVPVILVAGWLQAGNATKGPARPEVQEGTIEDFLEEVYGLARLKDYEGATDKIFDGIDRLLCDGAFFVCDEILRRLDVEKLPTPLMRSFLTITAAAKSKLSSRKALFQRIERKMMLSVGEEKTRRIVGKLA